MDTSLIEKCLYEATALHVAILRADDYAPALHDQVRRIREVAEDLHPNPAAESIRRLARIAERHTDVLEDHLLLARLQDLSVPDLVVRGIAHAALVSAIVVGDAEGDASEEMAEAWDLYQRVAENADAGIRRFARHLKSAVLIADKDFQAIGGGGITLQ